VSGLADIADRYRWLRGAGPPAFASAAGGGPTRPPPAAAALRDIADRWDVVETAVASLPAGHDLSVLR
jgi:hypothetical protein